MIPGILFISQLDGLLVLELSSCPIGGTETELVAIQLEFDVWTVQHRFRFSCIIPSSTSTSISIIATGRP